MKKHIFLLGMLCLYQSIASLTTSAQSFIQNVGQVTDQYLQTRNDIDFKISQQKGMQVYIGNGKIHYQWISKDVEDTNKYQSYRLDMELIGANLESPIDFGSVTNSYERYFLPWVNTQNSNEGKIAHQYQSITYKNIYPDIDWKLYFTADGKLEYDFILGSNAKVSDIKMKYSGMDSIKITNGGQLQIYTPKGIIREQAPYSYESVSKKTVNSSFVLQGETIGFKTGAYKGCLTIDPIVEWGTYYGSTEADAARSIIHDDFGHLYVLGTTSSITNIATTGAHQQTFAGGSLSSGADGLISKWTQDGQLLWATYYGGSRIDVTKRIKIGNDGHLYIAGYTNSVDGIASSNNVYQADKNGTITTYDIFIMKMDTAGTRLWSTYFGGNNNDGNTNLDFTISSTNMLVITGTMTSIDFPLTPNAYQNTANSIDAFVAKFDTQGNLIYSSLYGGAGTDNGTSITVDAQQNMYILGTTNSTNGIATSNTHQQILGGNYDAFIMKLDSMGQPIWSTYYGGTGEETASKIALYDTFIYIGGSTKSTTNISTTSGFQNTYSNLKDGYLARFTVNGTLEWATYINGSTNDEINDLVCNDESLYFILNTSSTDIITTNPIMSQLPGTANLAIGKVNHLGNLQWMSYYGGGNRDDNGILTIQSNNVYLAHTTTSGNNLSTPGVYEEQFQGSYDIFITKINDCDPPIPINHISGDTATCAGDVVRFEALGSTDAAYYTWILPSAWLGNSDSSSINVTVGTTDDTIKVVAFSACGTPSDTMHLGITVLPLPQATVTRQGNVLRTTTAFDNYQWLKDNELIAGATQPTYIISENGNYSVIVTNIQGCSDTSNVITISNLNTNHTASIAFSYYPNPISDVLHIESEQAGQLIMYWVS